MRRLRQVGAAVLFAALGSAAASAGVLSVQYGGPMMEEPYGGPPGFGPGMGPGPDGPGYGMGPQRRRTSPFRTYHGFRIDLADAQGVIDVGSALGEVEHQIDIVDRSGIGPSMLAMFRAVPIRVSPFFAGGHYSGGPEVTLGSLQPGDDRPVLLHEYMHVLEYRSFPGRFRNPTVRGFYEEARAGNLFPAESYMMSNAAEFFAVTASCYLNGTVARDPYTRSAIRQRQPDYYAYLARLFGPRGDSASSAPATVAAR